MSGPAAPDRLRGQLAAIAAMVVVFIGLAAAFTTEVVGAVEEARGMAARATAQSDAAGAVQDVLQDAEAGQRGFLLTMQPAYLAPYLAAVARSRAVFDGLDALARDNPSTIGDVRELRTLAQARLAELARAVEVAELQGQPAALATVLADDAKRTTDAARVRVDRIVAASARDRDARVAAIRERERWAAVGALGVTALGLLLLAAALADLLLRRRARARIVAALDIERLRLAGAVEALRDGIAMFDAGDRLVVWNPRLFAITGLPPGLGQAGATWSRFAQAAAGWPGAPLAPPHPGADAVSHEIAIGERMVELWRSGVADGGQLLLAVDVTRRTRAEAAARQANRMEALGQLTGGVAHDFNNLLQVVSANLELIGLRTGADAALCGRVAAAMAAVERAARLTRHLLAFARRQPLAPQALDPAGLLRGMEDMLARTLGQSVELAFDLDPEVWPIRADPAQLENAVLNLCINARDAMPQGGRLTLRAARERLDAPTEAVAGEEVAPGDYVLIAVEDTGTGMTPEQLVRAMEPFYTTKPEGRGTGLGLPMVFGFARQSGGTLRLASAPGRGTIASLHLPRSAAVPETPAAPAEPAASAAAAGELVLIVEDDPEVRAAAQLSIQALGYRTRSCDSTAAALTELRGGLRPDLLFSDVVMPGRPDAREMADEARRLVPSLAVVFTSGFTETAIVHDGQLDDDVILVGKPWRTVDLARQLRRALDGRAAAAAPRPTRILLVEDDALVRMTTADMLADFGHAVTQAADAAEARRLFADRPDLVITDIGLPDEDGLALADEFRCAGVPVVIASGAEPARATGFVWLQKPYDGAALRRAIAQAT